MAHATAGDELPDSSKDTELVVEDQNESDETQDQVVEDKGKRISHFSRKCEVIETGWRSSPKVAAYVVCLAIFLDSIFYALIIPILPYYAEEYALEQVMHHISSINFITS